MPGKKTFAVRKLTKETDFQKFISTGYHTYRGVNVNLKLNESFGYTPDYYVVNTTQHPGYDSKTNLESGSSDFLGVNYASNTQPMEFLIDVVASVRTYMRSASIGNWPDLSSSSALLPFLALEVEKALLNQPPTQTKEDWSTAASTIAEIIQGINWKHDGGTYDRHDLWLRRLVYVWALNWTEKMPVLAQNIAATNSMSTNFDRIIDIITCLIIYEIYFFFLIGYVQSDRAMMNIAFRGSDIAKKMIMNDLETAIDIDWDYFAKKNRVAYITGVTNHTSYVYDYIDDSLLKAGNLDSAIDSLRLKYIVPEVSLALARQLFGVGKANDNDNFCLLLQGASPNTSGDSQYHGTTKWTIGLETSVVQHLFEEMKQWNEEVQMAVARNKHHTWTELKSLVESYSVEFDFVGSLSGLAENEVYWGMRRAFAFADSTLDSSLSDEVVRDPQAVHTSSVINTGTASWKKSPIWPLIFLQGRISEKYGLVIPGDVTDKHLKYDLLLGLLFGLTSSTTWQNQRYRYCGFNFVQFIDTKTTEVVDLAYASAETPRWEFVKDPCYTDNSGSDKYPMISAKYNAFLLEAGVAAVEKDMQEQRPFGWKDIHPQVYDDFTDAELLRKYARLLLGKDNTTGLPADTSTIAHSTPEEQPTPAKSNDEDEEMT